MPPTSIKALSILGIALLGQAATAFPKRDGTNSTNSSIVSSYTPPEFIQNYNYTFCPANTKPIYVPAVFAYYPRTTHEVWAIIGDYFNITWINPNIKVTTEGTDNTIGAIRHQIGDPFAKTEVLTHYYNGEAPNNQGFFGQMSNMAPDTVDVAPGWTTEAIRPVLTMVPACGQKGAQLGFYLTYCMGSNATAQQPGFDEAAAAANFSKLAFNGSAGALTNLWKELDGSKGTAFNSTGSCAAISAYQGRDQQ